MRVQVPPAVVGALCSASLLFHPMELMAVGPPPTLNEAIVEFSEATHPILKAQRADFGECAFDRF